MLGCPCKVWRSYHFNHAFIKVEPTRLKSFQPACVPKRETALIMGVTGLWTVVSPTARPTALATLNRKRLAVDASIWIYQFLKAVRDKEGNALRNSHVVGFFRRICKLLYFGIKPVFVFDGGAPLLKRETVRKRARRREGRAQDSRATAAKVLAVQMAREAEEAEKRRKHEQAYNDVEEEVPDDVVYVDELGMSQQERKQNRGFKRKDQYHLPDLDVSIESMGAPNDPRIMSQAELEEYARQFHSGEDINLYDFSKIDFESPFFLSLPPGDRYNILNAARLRSRLRMGYSKEQLDGMFPDRMAFSKFQIERVKERNELTQRLMHVNGMAEDYLHQGGRIAGEKGKEYVLVRNEGVEGGWALGVVSNKHQGNRENAIDVDEEEIKSEVDTAQEEEEEEFEDVAVEGLNRLPKPLARKSKALQDLDYNPDYHAAAEKIAKKRKAVYEARQQAARKRGPQPKPAAVELAEVEDPDAMFMPETANGVLVGGDEDDDLFEDVDMERDNAGDSEDDNLQKAIAMSLEQNGDEPAPTADAEPSEYIFRDQGKSTGRQVASMVNRAAAVGRSNALQQPDDETLDLQAALAESRKSKRKPETSVREGSPPFLVDAKPTQEQHSFSGPLPFESLNLGQSLLGKKKAKKVEEDMSGGFDRDLGEDGKERKALPVPSWFDAAPTTRDMANANAAADNEFDDHVTYGREDIDRRQIATQKQIMPEIIDVDAPTPPKREGPFILDSSEDEEEGPAKLNDNQNDGPDHEPDALAEPMIEAEQEDLPVLERLPEPKVAPFRTDHIGRQLPEYGGEPGTEQRPQEDVNDSVDIHMEDVAELAKAQPPPPSNIPNHVPDETLNAEQKVQNQQDEDEEEVDWSESDVGNTEEATAESNLDPADRPTLGHLTAEEEPEQDVFEDVDTAEKSLPILRHERSTLNAEDAALTAQYLVADEGDDQGVTEAAPDGTTADEHSNEQYLSDSDEELMRQLAVEAEEHTRFVQSLSNKSKEQAARDYENELKALRNQQKKDRRDADEVTQTMIQECQALLRLFGLPYITAPMEAEAQCAELVHLGLVDGIVTDDSDIFLFGGTRIYKNMFNAAKFVECYLAADLEKEYALDRKRLIRFAHLLGSDYTEGIPGIGPVSALEILTDFDTLEEFKQWCAKVQHATAKTLEGQLTTPFRRKFKNTAQKRLFLPTQFPDTRVDQAYLQPEVDSNPEEFAWGVPDLDKLRSFLMATIGWSQERTDEILVPVIRTLNQQEKEGTQANITNFFSGGVGAGAAQGNAPRNRTGKESGRLQKSFARLKSVAQNKRRADPGELDGEVADPTENVDAMSNGDTTARNGSQDAPSSRKARGKKRAAKNPKSKSLSDASSADEDDEAEFMPAKKSKTKRHRKAANED